MSHYLVLNKPFNVLSSFTDPSGRATLADYVPVPGVYAAGRLDYDSEGLLLLTGDGALIHRLTDPRYEHPKTYYVQLEGLVTEAAAASLRQGVLLRGQHTRPAEVEIITDPRLPARPVPVRAYHPTSWLKVILREGQKRQLRRMTAAVGFPTLRLVRWAIGPLTLEGLAPGQWRELTRLELNLIQK